MRHSGMNPDPTIRFPLSSFCKALNPIDISLAGAYAVGLEANFSSPLDGQAGLGGVRLLGVFCFRTCLIYATF